MKTTRLVLREHMAATTRHDLHKESPKAKTPHEQESLQRQIAAADKSIDALAYELYGLTEEEIRIVEGGEK